MAGFRLLIYIFIQLDIHTLQELIYLVIQSENCDVLTSKQCTLSHFSFLLFKLGA